MYMVSICSVQAFYRKEVFGILNDNAFSRAKHLSYLKAICLKILFYALLLYFSRTRIAFEFDTVFSILTLNIIGRIQITHAYRFMQNLSINILDELG